MIDKRINILCTLVIIISTILLDCSNTNEDKWKYIGSYDSDSIYYDKNSLNYLSDGVVQVWMMSKISKEKINEIINMRKQLNMPIKGYDKLTHELSLVELDCKKRTFKQIMIREYDDKGNTLSECREEIQINISPNSRGEILYLRLCSK